MKFINEFDIAGKKVGNNQPTYFIADIAANHDGDIERAIDLIYLCAEAGADAAKFQHFKAETIVSNKGFKGLGSQLSHQSSWKKDVFEVYKDASVNLNWTERLVEACKKAGIPFFTTPYSLDIIDYMDKYVPAYKIGSGDITWKDMVEGVAAKQKPYILASGASSMDEVYRAVKDCSEINQKLCLMQCNTNYTASLENMKFIQLNVLNSYRQMFPDLLLGLSDHTPGHSTVLGAVSLGARMIEKHFTDDITREGPDHKFSMDFNSWSEMVQRTRELENALGTGVKKVEANELDTVIVQRRAMRTNKNIKKGSVISKEDFAALRPCPEGALNPYEFEKVIGLKATHDIECDTTVTYRDFY